MATLKDLSNLRGDTAKYTLTITKADGTAQDITGWTVWMTIKAAFSDTDAQAKVQKIVTTHTNPTGGVTTITILASDTTALSGTYYYDIQIKKTDATIETVLYGDYVISEDITRSIA